MSKSCGAVRSRADRLSYPLSFRNVHNWVKGGYEREMFKAFYAALKPGGVLGIVEHRAKPGTSLEKMKTSGYNTEALVPPDLSWPRNQKSTPTGKIHAIIPEAYGHCRRRCNWEKKTGRNVLRSAKATA